MDAAPSFDPSFRKGPYYYRPYQRTFSPNYARVAAQDRLSNGWVNNKTRKGRRQLLRSLSIALHSGGGRRKPFIQDMRRGHPMDRPDRRLRSPCRSAAILQILPLGRRVSGASSIFAVGAHRLHLPTVVAGPAKAEVDNVIRLLDRLQLGEPGADHDVLIHRIEGATGGVAVGVVDKHRSRSRYTQDIYKGVLS